MQAEFMALGLERLDLGDEPEPDRARERRLHQEAGPAGLLDQMDRVTVGQFRLRPADALPQPLPQIGGAAQVDEKRIGNAEIPADGLDPGKPVRDAHPMIHVPAKREQPVGHRPALALTLA